jgi:RNA polymerase sigma factor (sigma-70 family)
MSATTESGSAARPTAVAAFPELLQDIHANCTFRAKRKGFVDDAEDIASEVILAVLQTSQPIDSLRAYAFGIFRHLEIHWIEHRCRRRETFAEGTHLDRFAGEAPDPEKVVREKIRETNRAKLVSRVLGMVNDKDRAILERFYLDEVGREAVQRELGLNDKQFINAKHRALEKVRKRCAESELVSEAVA